MSETLLHAVTFLGAVLLIYFFGGILIAATDAIARRLNRDGFLVAFILLGTLTSISEMSVAVSATLSHAPDISAGNLIGASVVIFLAIIPVLAIFGRGILFKHNFSSRHLLLALGVIGLPAIIVFDGEVSRGEGAVMVLSYIFLLFYTRKSRLSRPHVSLIKPTESIAHSLGKVTISSVVIFLSGRLLVSEAIFFSGALGIPSSFFGLIVIAIGTNVPELVIAFRAIADKQKAIAFGDYVGSAAFNTLIFGVLALYNGAFVVAPDQFMLTSFFLVVGLGMFYVFSRSKNDISRAEGVLLATVYTLFILIQCGLLLLS